MRWLEQWMLFVLDFSKAFIVTSRNSLTGRLMKYGLGQWAVRWIKIWQFSQPHRVVMSFASPAGCLSPHHKCTMGSKSGPSTVRNLH